MKELETYDDLLNALQAMTPEQRKQKIQLAGPDTGPLTTLHPGIAIGTVTDAGFYACRSIYDNKYHGEDVVILFDHNPFGEHGEVSYTIDFNQKKNKTERARLKTEGAEFRELLHVGSTANFGRYGRTDFLDQCSPEAKQHEIELRNKGEEASTDAAKQRISSIADSTAEVHILRHRAKTRRPLESNIQRRFFQIVADQFDVVVSVLTFQTDICKDLKADTFDIIELTMYTEAEFVISIDDEDIYDDDGEYLFKVTTLGDWVEMIQAKLAK